MTTLKIIALTFFIFLSVCLLIDITFIVLNFISAYKSKKKYTKTLWGELIMLLLWSFCLSILIVL